jgi:hypothetical protein
MLVRGERAEGPVGEAPSDQTRVPGGVWHSSWGLRLSLGFVAVLVWAGATSVPSSPTPVRGTSVSPTVSTPAVVPPSPAPPAPAPMDPATATPTLPRQTLNITYDYGPGPQPVAGQSTALLP